MPAKAILFIDGNNWYHSLKNIDVFDPARLDYRKISQKIIGRRNWVGTRYYIGQVVQSGNKKLYADQRQFTASLQATDRRISVHFGRLEQRPVKDPTAEKLRRYLAELPRTIDREIYQRLSAIAKAKKTTIIVEKAVDVMIAVDLVTMAMRGEYDAAYLLSADGDFTPAARAVKAIGRKIYAASPAHGAQLASAVDSFIPLDRAWFLDCYR